MITTDYVYNGEVIGKNHYPEQLPTFLKIPSRHTLQDLLAIKVDHPNHPFVFVDSVYVPPPVDWDAKLRTAYLLYHKCATANGIESNPRFETWQNRLRWSLYRLLQRAGVTF